MTERTVRLLLANICLNWDKIQNWYNALSEDEKDDIINYFDEHTDNLGMTLLGVDARYVDVLDLVNSFEEEVQFKFVTHFNNALQTKMKAVDFKTR